MKRTPMGTSVGVDDPYDHAGRCDHLTSDGRCRLAMTHAESAPEFARERRAADYECLLAERDDHGTVSAENGALADEGDVEWRTCPQYRFRARNDECARCGLEERRVAHSDERPLLEEHHLSYQDVADGPERGDPGPTHEITVHLCRWCHANVHNSWARIDDDVSPDPEALAEREGRRSRELSELGFESAADRYRSE